MALGGRLYTCSSCHTIDGYLAVRPLVAGKGAEALSALIARLALPVDSQGRETAWTDPHLRLKTWRGRRMPPFPGTDAEREALAFYLARLGGAPATLPAAPAAASPAKAYFDEQCSACHGHGRLFFTAAVLMAVPWITVVPVLILAYYGTYLARPSASRPLPPPWLLWAVALGFAAIAFIYSNVMGLVLRPEEFAGRFQATASGLQFGFSDPTLIARFLHMLLGALAVSGLAVALAGGRAGTRDTEFGAWASRQGVYWCAGATILNFLPGFWWLAALPREVLLGFMGQNPLATTWFVLGVLAALGALALLVPAAFAPQPGRLLLGATAGLVLSLVFMVLVRDAAREMTLAQIGFRTTPWVEPQWGPIGIFLVVLLAAVGTVIWMVVALARGTEAQRRTQPKPEDPGLAGA